MLDSPRRVKKKNGASHQRVLLILNWPDCILPSKCGARFSKNAAMPSCESVKETTLLATPSPERALLPMGDPFQIVRHALGDRRPRPHVRADQRFAPHSMTCSKNIWSVSPSKDRLIKPKVLGFFIGDQLTGRHQFSDLERPSARANLCVPPVPGRTPSFTSGRPQRPDRFAPHEDRSQSNFQPAPNAMSTQGSNGQLGRMLQSQQCLIGMQTKVVFGNPV